MEEVTFEKSINELEKIVAELEKDEMSLNEMLVMFEKGVSLSKKCNELLEQAEKKINILVKKDGEIEKQPFDGGEEE